jgi:hypothetical protein
VADAVICDLGVSWWLRCTRVSAWPIRLGKVEIGGRSRGNRSTVLGCIFFLKKEGKKRDRKNDLSLPGVQCHGALSEVLGLWQ